MPTAVLQNIPAATWSVDSVHSSAGFAVKYMVSTYRTGFERFDATLDTTGEEPKLVGTVDPTSIRTKDEHFHEHLQSPEFFDSATHSELRFASTSFQADGDALVVAGELTIKGNTRPVQARGTLTPPYEDQFGNERIGVVLEAAVDRTAFGLDWNADLPKGGKALANEITLEIELFLVRG